MTNRPDRPPSRLPGGGIKGGGLSCFLMGMNLSTPSLPDPPSRKAGGRAFRLKGKAAVVPPLAYTLSL